MRRYLWNHFSLLGDRFEYRGRGRELFIGFLLVLLMLAVWGGLMWLAWITSSTRAARRASACSTSSRCPWRSSAFRSPCRPVCRTALPALAHALARHPLRAGGLGLGLRRDRHLPHFANAMTAQLLTPVVSVNLARPRIANAASARSGSIFAGTPATSTAATSVTTSSTSCLDRGDGLTLARSAAGRQSRHHVDEIAKLFTHSACAPC